MKKNTRAIPDVESIDLNRFKSLAEFTDFLETHALELYAAREVDDMWVKYKKHTDNDQEKILAQTELDCWSYEIYGSNSFARAYSIDTKSGDIIHHPDLSKEKSDRIDYIKSRAEETKSAMFKSKYSHLLWTCLPVREKKPYGLEAIAQYAVTIRDYHAFCDRRRKIPGEGMYRLAGLFESLVCLSEELKITEEAKKISKWLLFVAPQISFHLKCNFLTFMINRPKVFKPNDFEKVLKIFEDEIAKQRKGVDDFLLVTKQFDIAIKIASKTNSDVRLWYVEKGNAYLRLAKRETKPDRFWLKQDHHANAIEAYRMAGAQAQRKEAEKRYAALKSKIKLPTHRHRYPENLQNILKEYDKNIQNDASNWLKKTPPEIYEHLYKGNYIPRKETLATTSNTSDLFTQFATLIVFDKNKNVSRPTDEKRQNEWGVYQNKISITTVPFLHYVLIRGIQSGHLTMKNFLQFLTERTWIGQPYLSVDLGGEKVEVNWIHMLAPAILEFFIQVRASGSSTYYTPNFILCIDGLTLKMEGLFRNFSERNRIPTSTNKPKKGMQEVYVHNMIENETMKKYFGEDDLTFFNYLFSNEGGANLRNNVAHCFYKPWEYNSDKMLLLISALMRIAHVGLSRSSARQKKI